MLRKSMIFVVVLALMLTALSTNVFAAKNEGKLEVEWYDLGPENEDSYNAIRALRDAEELDTILESDISTKLGKSELSQFAGAADGHGLLFLEGDNFKNLVIANIEDKADPNTFGMVITGYFTPKENGKYKFRLWSDDSARFKLGDNWVVSTWGEPEEDGRTWEQERISNEIELKAGQAYPIRVEYFDGWGGHMLQITMSKDGGDFAPIPANLFSYGTPDETQAPTNEPTDEPQTPATPATSDASILLTLLVAGAAAFGGLKLKK